MKLYNFIRLINKYSVDFVCITQSAGGYDDGGVYIAGEKTETPLRGAIIPMTERKIYQLGGNYTSEDRELYMIKRIDSALLGGKVLYKGEYFAIEEETDYSDYADIFHYILRKEVPKNDT